MEWLIAILVLIVGYPLLVLWQDKRKHDLYKYYSKLGVEAKRRKREGK